MVALIRLFRFLRGSVGALILSLILLLALRASGWCNRG